MDNVKNPRHYQLMGVEAIEVVARSMTPEMFKGYCLGNVLKYRLRAGKKGDAAEDLAKAEFYEELYTTHADKTYIMRPRRAPSRCGPEEVD